MTTKSNNKYNEIMSYWPAAGFTLYPGGNPKTKALKSNSSSLLSSANRTLVIWRKKPKPFICQCYGKTKEKKRKGATIALYFLWFLLSITAIENSVNQYIL